MQFMTVFSYDPAHRDEVITRRLEFGAKMPPGITQLGEWSYLGSGKVFTLVDVTDPLAAFEATRAWSDLGTIEIFPVVEADKILPVLAAGTQAAAVR